MFIFCTVAKISFEQSTYRINENADDPLKPVLIISTLSSLDITIQVTDNSSTATGKWMLIPITSIIWYHTGGEDYNSGPYDVTIPAGMMKASFDITINNDNIVEGNEDFTLIIITSSSLLVGDTNKATVTIVDDEGN